MFDISPSLLYPVAVAFPARENVLGGRKQCPWPEKEILNNCIQKKFCLAYAHPVPDCMQ